MSTNTGLRVVVTGATGNVGTSVVRALSADSRIASVLGLARRVPDLDISRTAWASVDLAQEDATGVLVRHLDGADAVIHLAWRFQPTHSPVTTWQTNVLGSLRLFEAVAEARVPVLVHASSVGAYSPGPKTGAGVDESWPTHGWPDAAYCREKAYLERVLDAYELRHPEVRVARIRPGFMFKESSASEQRRIFAGRFLPGPLLNPALLPFVPDLDGLRFQALHTDDTAQAYLLAVLLDARGAFNLAAEPVIDAPALGELLRARVVRVPRRAVHAALSAAWSLRAVPASPHLFDALLRMPVMNTARAREELDWQPRHTSTAALEEFLRGVRRGAGEQTAPLAGHRAH
ncbi:NAD-dependent epimerase/dehydratase family protein [Streptomyces xantholiticus]|uniref:NAD-dependent epimerase/dehydratase family protein n=1 Tax=Streptomyces xantholiticus TaxID=68285 RepID=A0ABV1UMA1_9ACTN